MNQSHGCPLFVAVFDKLSLSKNSLGCLIVLQFKTRPVLKIIGKNILTNS